MSPLNNVPPWIVSPFWKSLVHKKGKLFKFLHFEIASLVNVPGYYLRKYGIFLIVLNWKQMALSWSTILYMEFDIDLLYISLRNVVGM